MTPLEPFKQLTSGLRFVLAYLLLTPLFWLADIVFGLEIRIAFLEDTGWKSVYYSVLLTSGVFCYQRPNWTALIVFFESTANVFIHVLSFTIPVFTLHQRVLHNQPAEAGFTANHAVSFVLVGTIMALSFHSAVDALRDPAWKE